MHCRKYLCNAKNLVHITFEDLSNLIVHANRAFGLHFSLCSFFFLLASRESHKAQRAIQATRRAHKPHSSLLTSAKSIWSLVRQKNIPTSERQKHVTELIDVIRGKVKDIVLKHDASRIVQSAVKYGGQKERDEIAKELEGSYKELAQNKYSKVSI
jgi:hypothetical protein